VPAIIERAGAKAILRFAEFFALCYRNRNTRESYARDLRDFADWCERRGIRDVRQVTPMAVAAHIEWLGKTLADPSVKRHLAAIRKLMDWLVTGHIIEVSPAWSVKGPKHKVTRGSTPILSSKEAHKLLDSIPRNTLAGLRDRAAITVMLFAFARVSAMSKMHVRDFFIEKGDRAFRLHEKGGKPHRVKAHRVARLAVEQYIRAARLGGSAKAPLFQTLDIKGRLTGRAMTRNDVFRMVRRRARHAGLPAGVCSHSFRGTGLTEYMRKGGDLRTAARLANHASVRTTQLYIRLEDDVELAEIERVDI
jgi:site-specific recombinase XerD